MYAFMIYDQQSNVIEAMEGLTLPVIWNIIRIMEPGWEIHIFRPDGSVGHWNLRSSWF